MRIMYASFSGTERWRSRTQAYPSSMVRENYPGFEPDGAYFS